MTEIATKISAFITDNLLLGRSVDVAGSTSFLEAGIIDSTGVLELVAFIEGEFGIVVDDDDLVPANLDSIAGVAAFVRAKRSAQGAAVEG